MGRRSRCGITDHNVGVDAVGDSQFLLDIEDDLTGRGRRARLLKEEQVHFIGTCRYIAALWRSSLLPLHERLQHGTQTLLHERLDPSFGLAESLTDIRTRVTELVLEMVFDEIQNSGLEFVAVGESILALLLGPGGVSSEELPDGDGEIATVGGFQGRDVQWRRDGIIGPVEFLLLGQDGLLLRQSLVQQRPQGQAMVVPSVAIAQRDLSVHEPVCRVDDVTSLSRFPPDLIAEAVAVEVQRRRLLRALWLLLGVGGRALRSLEVHVLVDPEAQLP